MVNSKIENLPHKFISIVISYFNSCSILKIFSYLLTMQIQRFILLSLLHFISFCTSSNGFNVTADVGVILDLHSAVGKMYKTCISMAIEDFYSRHENYSTRIVPHFRESNGDVIDAASAAIDLLKNTQVVAILGPQNSVEADFLINIGAKVRVPIISLATSVVVSPKESPYFIRSAWSSSYQATAIAAIVKAFGWREVAFISDDSNYGGGLVSSLTNDLLQINALVSYQSFLSPAAEDDQILKELYKLMTMQTRVFVVHVEFDIASRFFKLAKEVGMMNEGYAWITTDVLTSLLGSVDSETIEVMQGVVGVKAFVPTSDELFAFTKRWRKRVRSENPGMDRKELNAFELWIYDSVTALAESIERVGMTSQRFHKPGNNKGNLTDLEAIGTSNAGQLLVPLIRNFKSKGLSGDFHIVNGQLQPSAFEIVNVNGRGEKRVGFWTGKYGISKELKNIEDDYKAVYSTNKSNLGTIVWPGQTSDRIPRGWEISTSGKKLRVGVPVKGGFSEFVKVERDAETRAVIVSGFSIDVFEQAMKLLSYPVTYEYIPFETSDGKSARNYDDLIYQIYQEKYDAMVGDVSILAERTKYVDFTIPYAESGISAIVPIKDNVRKDSWIFVKPLTTGLWLTIGAFFVFTGIVVWVLEHRVNKEFRGPPLKQVGMIFWFSFSTLVFAHREKVISNLTRFIVVVWVFVVLVLTSSYTASLTSMLTAQKLQSSDIFDLIKKGEYVGYQEGTFLTERLNTSKLRSYSSLEEYDDTLSKGSKNGGVAAIVDELIYLKLLLSKFCEKYVMIGPTYASSGLGFAFRKGSPLVADVSSAILNLKEGEEMVRISRKWFGDQSCSHAGSESLNLDNFKGLFLISGLSLSLALLVFLFIFLYKNRHIFRSTSSTKQKLYELARAFAHEKDDESLPT